MAEQRSSSLVFLIGGAQVIIHEFLGPLALWSGTEVRMNGFQCFKIAPDPSGFMVTRTEFYAEFKSVLMVTKKFPKSLKTTKTFND